MSGVAAQYQQWIFRPRQKGMVLILCLILLLVMTLLGVSGMTNVLMQEQMVGALKESSVALEAAESALRDAEAALTGIDPEDFGTTPGLYLADTEPVDPFAESLWTTNASIEAATTVDGVLTPRYYIVRLGGMTVTARKDINIRSYNEAIGSGALTGFKVVARGQGEAGNGQRIIVGYFGLSL